MKKYLFLFALLVAGLSSCQKIISTTQAKNQAIIDDQKIQDYINANKLSYTKDANTGVYYKIVTQGTAPNPTALSTVKLTYHYEYLNGVVIGDVIDVQSKLNGFIAGLQFGIPKIGTGGRIMLILPSAQAYGFATQNGIPGNSVLVYTVDLEGVTAN
ncbi:FKBP-type peptidyl-prolyl cis-trans isomerase [Mucilaginibacter sp. dw_454]|uniref:FKBP-type peptidyl-prolyl cis-trans isomerase n=1 Tax=Mucilaginibacter sp. dw_454 TaxID=2720079 RepID=UPI001BD343BE|nr:FKBP-type peptidyl-prolyl cis-trans isomerase [Mucilaginibacter sp. dw_454]